jgi:hypothetical protein
MGYKVEGTTESDGADMWSGGTAKSGSSFRDKQPEGHCGNHSHM